MDPPEMSVHAMPNFVWMHWDPYPPALQTDLKEPWREREREKERLHLSLLATTMLYHRYTPKEKKKGNKNYLRINEYWFPFPWCPLCNEQGGLVVVLVVTHIASSEPSFIQIDEIRWKTIFGYIFLRKIIKRNKKRVRYTSDSDAIHFQT